MYVLMGANGNITSKAAQILLRQGEKVRVIGRNAANLDSLAKAEKQVADAPEEVDSRGNPIGNRPEHH